MLRPMVWDQGVLRMLDQRRLPCEEVWLDLTTVEDVVQAIQNMTVRGAPAIGIAAAYGMAIAALAGADLEDARLRLAASRPTAVNLSWALARVAKIKSPSPERVLQEARAIESEDLAMNQAIGRHGAGLIQPGAQILTLCNTGALATAGHGTALGIIRTAWEQGKQIHVWSCETRPRQQGLRLTAYELEKERIPFHSLVDSSAAGLMKDGKVDCVLVGADRIACNGDTANKIGTYMLAVLARHHSIPFYVAAPSSTLDFSLRDGTPIPIENRSAEEITHSEGARIAPRNCPVFNPAFDVTPGHLVTAIVTEEGIWHPPFSFAPGIGPALVGVARN